MTPLWDWDTAVADWTTAMQAAGRSPRTIRLYTCHLHKVIRECPDGPASVTSTDLRFVLSAGSWKPETRKSVRGSVAAFFRWAHGAGFIPADPAQGLAAVRVPAGVARPVPDDVLHDALARADERDRTMILLGAYAGLRCMEIARVHSRDWDGSGLYVTGKAAKPATSQSCAWTCAAPFLPAAATCSPGKMAGTSRLATSRRGSREHSPRAGPGTPSGTGAAPPCTQVPATYSPWAQSSDTRGQRRRADTCACQTTPSLAPCALPPNH